MKTTNLEKWLYLVRRIEEHREEKAVRELQKLYRSLIKDLRKVMGNTFADYADPETGKLTYADLHRQGLDARLLEEVAAHVSSVSSEESRIIRETVEQTYANCYSGMVQAVGKAVDNEELKEAFSAVEAVKPEVLRAAVNNPVHGLTLSDQLEKNRADIVWGIKQAVGVGLSEGDNYTTMAKRIQKELIGPDGSGGSYYKAVRIARTEAHRVREEGNLDAAQNLTEKLEPAGMTMVKTWHTMKDERVRPNRARKTKGGWKYSKGGKYDHQKMEGVQVPINEEFTLPSGAKTQAPGKSGVAGEDINCRCFLSYDVVQTVGLGAQIGSPENMVPMHDEPIYIKTIDIKDEKAIKMELDAFEAESYKLDQEEALVILSTGEVHRCFGTLKGVYPDFDFGRKLKGAYVAHNHVESETRWSFSNVDINLFQEYNLAEMRGCDVKYKYRLNKNQSDLDEMTDNWQDEEEFQHNDVIRTALQRGFGYRRLPNDTRRGKN